MKLRFLRRNALQELWKSIPDNLERYRNGDFRYLREDPSYWIEVNTEYDPHQFSNMDGSEGVDSEVASSLVVFRTLDNIDAYMARDPRLWTYITHVDLLEYTLARWPISNLNDERAIRQIANHFFGRGRRGIERDNSASRLWWMAKICSRVDDMELEYALRLFLKRADVRANILERPTTSQSSWVFKQIIKSLDKSLQTGTNLYERQTFRKAMKRLNVLGGHMLLETLPPNVIQDALTEEIS